MFTFATGNEGIDDDLGAIEKITKLSFPHY